MPKGQYFNYQFDASIKQPKSTKSKHQRILKEIIGNQNKDIEKLEDTEAIIQDTNFDNDFDDNANNFEIYDEVDDHSKEIQESFSNIIAASEQENKHHNEIDLACGLLSTFFSTKITLSAFSTILDFLRIIKPEFKIPKSFNECSNLLLKSYSDEIFFEKKWYCNNCDTYIILNHPKQRICNVCTNR